MRTALHEVAQVLLTPTRTWSWYALVNANRARFSATVPQLETSTTLYLDNGDLPLPKPIRSTTLAVNLLVPGECRLKRQAKKQE
jgi:hypothetical protein